MLHAIPLNRASARQPASARKNAAAVLLALLLGASAPVHASGARSVAPVESGVDASVVPGDNFFAFANGEWLAAGDIPAGKERRSARTEIDEATRARILQVLDEAGKARAGSTARKLADFRAAYLDQAAIEARGLAPLQSQLNRIAAVRDKTALARLLGRELRADVDPLNWGVFDSSHLFGLAVDARQQGSTGHVVYLLQGGLGLPDRAHYASTEADMLALRGKYRAYIAHVLEEIGIERAAHRAEAVLTLEIELARSQATPEASANESNAANFWDRAEFTQRAPGMDWSAFFAAAGLAKQQTFVAWQPEALTGASAQVASQPLQVWQDYLRFHLVDRYADVLPRDLAARAFAFHGVDVAGLKEPAPRAERALAATQAAMGEALGRVYVERYFSPAVKARVATIVADVIAAFGRRLETTAWMSPETRVLAQAKLQTLYFGVGYPERWQDYADLSVDAKDALGNLQRVADRNYRRALARLDEPVDMAEWRMLPQQVGALLLFHQNAYNFPAGLLQAPKFDPAASDAANYGAIGAIVGHEVSHFVDTLGADYDAQGRKRHWWSSEDLARYQASAEPLVKQFSGYRPFADLAVDGKLTLGENSADLAGLLIAFDAHRRRLGAGASNEVRRAADRQFFIGFARGWRSEIREDAMRTQLTTDGHAPEAYRVATVRNVDAWYDAFDVRPGQHLYLAPEARVRIW